MASESRPSVGVAGRAPLVATALTLAAATVCWAVVIAQARAMSAMGMGLGSIPSFTATWTLMMAATMLPSALPFIRAYVGLPGGNPWPFDTTLLVAAYLAVWAVFGIAADYIYTAIGMPWPSQDRKLGVTLCLASLYALTPIKRQFAAGCRSICDQLTARVGTMAIERGVAYGLNCVGCSAGVMVVILVAGMSNLVWMVIVAAIVLLYKVLPPSWRWDAAVAFVMLVAGVWLAAFPAAVPMLLMPSADG